MIETARVYRKLPIRECGMMCQLACANPWRLFKTTVFPVGLLISLILIFGNVLLMTLGGDVDSTDVLFDRSLYLLDMTWWGVVLYLIASVLLQLTPPGVMVLGESAKPVETVANQIAAVATPLRVIHMLAPDRLPSYAEMQKFNSSEMTKIPTGFARELDNYRIGSEDDWWPAFQRLFALAPIVVVHISTIREEIEYVIDPGKIEKCLFVRSADPESRRADVAYRVFFIGRTVHELPELKVALRDRIRHLKRGSAR
ncbi:MAG: hypothetical protein CMJ50_04285 [Planctomycetaceae bacterium]|nr:hypothetical protein [Planctomycetaceae bacterium]